MDTTFYLNTIWLACLIGFISTIVLLFLAYKFIIPEKRKAKLNKLGLFLHDAFNFKFLIIEKVMQFFYVLATITTICFGISMIFYIDIYHSSWYSSSHWYGIYGIILAIVGPIALRVSYELIMMFILLVKNVMQINNKLKSADTEEYQFPNFKELVAKENFDFIKNKKVNVPQSTGTNQAQEPVATETAVEPENK